jgi:hypothetical protein
MSHAAAILDGTVAVAEAPGSYAARARLLVLHRPDLFAQEAGRGLARASRSRIDGRLSVPGARAPRRGGRQLALPFPARAAGMLR